MRLIIAIALLLVVTVAPGVMGQETVRLATLEWEPYITSRRSGAGYVAEVVVETFKRVNYSTEITFLPWARALAEAGHGNYDGLFPEYFNERRMNAFVYSDPFPGGPVGLYKRKDNPAHYSISPLVDQTEALRSLQNFRFGVVRGYINTEEFDRASFLKKEVVGNDTSGLRMLYNGRIDFIFIDKLTAEYIIHSQFPQYQKDLEFMEPALETKSLHIAFSKQTANSQRKIDAFNSGLKQIIDDGTLAKIVRKHGFEQLFHLSFKQK